MAHGNKTLACFKYFDDKFNTYRLVVKEINGKVFVGDCKWSKPNNHIESLPRGYCFTPLESWEEKLKAVVKVSEYLNSRPNGTPHFHYCLVL